MSKFRIVGALALLAGLGAVGYALGSVIVTPDQTVVLPAETFPVTSPSGLVVQVIIPPRTVTIPGQTVTIPDSTTTVPASTVPVTTVPATTAPPASTTPPGSGTQITTSAFWGCTKPLSSYGKLPITVHSNVPNTVQYAIGLDAGCTGDGNNSTIDLILDVNGDGKTHGTNNDAVKVRGGHDIQVTGDIECGARATGAHQDGVQAQQGVNVTFQGLTSGDVLSGAWTCWGAGGSFFISQTSGALTDVVCDGCRLTAWNQGLGINSGLRSGARNSYFRTLRASACRVVGGTQPVNENNTCVRKA